MVLKCYVKLLDGTHTEFEVDKTAKASVLFNNVCKHVNILEKHYFGLTCKRPALQHCWLNLEKKIRKQVNKNDKLEFEFAVKFYPSDPALLQEGITRYQICLQIREDLKNHLECSLEKLANLICFWLKSDYQEVEITSQAVRDCLREIGSTNNEESSPEFIDHVLALSQTTSDMSSAEADEQFLRTAASLKLYGVHFYKGKEPSGSDILIGISSKGVTEKRKDQLPVLHTWSRIKNIEHNNCKFKIKLVKAPVNGDPRLKKSFIFDSREQVLVIWKSAVDHHVFFRVGAKDSDKRTKRKGSILRRLSSKKKKPKTEFDAQEESKSINRKPPNVTRVNSIRMSTNPKPTIPKEQAVEKGPDSDAPESNKTPETVPKSVEAHSIPLQSSEILTADLDFPGAVAMSNQENDVYATIGEKMPTKPYEEEREYTDDDIADVIVNKPEGSASGGSSTFLFTETIIEEEEEDNIYGVPSPRKAVPTNDGQSSGIKVFDELDQVSGDEIMQRSVDGDPPEFKDDLNQYSEEWMDVSVSIAPTAKKDVRFETNATVCDDDDDKESSVELSFSFASSDENDATLPTETPHDIHDTEYIVPVESVRQYCAIDSPPTSEGQVLLDDEQLLLTIKEYVPKARKDSTEESDVIEESDVEQYFDSPDAGAALHTEPESNAKDLDSKPSSIVRSDDSIGQNPFHIDDTTPADDIDQQKESVESSNDSTNAKSSHGSPALSGRKEPIYRKSARSLGIDFRVGDAYKPINTKGSEKVIDGAASTTAATIGDEDDFSMHESDEDILFGHDYSNSEENDEDDTKVSDHSDDDTDMSASHEEILRQNAPLDTRNESFKDLLGSKLSERNHDGAASTTAATIGDEDVLSLAEFDDDTSNEEVTKESARPSDEAVTNQDRDELDIANDKTDSDSKYSSLSNVTGDTDELLDIDALEKAWSQGAQLDENDELFRVLFRSPPKRKPRNKSEINLTDVKRGRQQAMAFRSGIDEEPVSPRRRENLVRRPFIPSWPFDPMAILTSNELHDLDCDALDAAIAAQMYMLDGEKRLEEMDMMEDDRPYVDDDDMMMLTEEIATVGKQRNLGLAEKVKVRSRSPSASPRMVGEEFIPGVPDFVHSVVPYQLPTPEGDADETKIQEMTESQNPCLQESTFPEENHDCDRPVEDIRTPNDAEIIPDEKSDHEVDRSVLSDAGLPTASSGRSTPSGSNSLSEGTSSSNSKSSGSSFPRFVHSVFPLRRTSEDRRGRSKTRRKREKKITKQKNKKVARSKSRDKKGVKNVPSIAVSSAPQVEGFKAFPILCSPPISSKLPQSLTDRDNDKQTSSSNTPNRLYDQESLDKITLSDSDDAHSKPKAACPTSGECGEY